MAIDGIYQNVETDRTAFNPSLWSLLDPRSRDPAADVGATENSRVTDSVAIHVARDGQVSSALIRDGKIVARQTIRFSAPGQCAELNCTYASNFTITPYLILWVSSDQRDALQASHEKLTGDLEFLRGWSAMMWLGIIPINSSGWVQPYHYHFARVPNPRAPAIN